MRRRDCAEWAGAWGPNGVGGEWGHNPLPWATADERPGPQCFCGQRGCLETWISGTGLAADYRWVTERALTGPDIVAAAAAGDAAASASLARLEERIGRALAMVVNMMDPDVIVIGGGLSQLDRLYVNLPALIERHLFGGGMSTPVRKAKHGMRVVCVARRGFGRSRTKACGRGRHGGCVAGRRRSGGLANLRAARR